MKRFLRTLLCTGILGMVAAAAQAQARVFGGVRVPFRPAVVAAVPACPGVGYVWAPGYYAGAVWYPGRWIYRGGYVGGGFYGRYDRGYYGRGYRDYDRHDYRHYDRDHDRGWDRR